MGKAAEGRSLVVHLLNIRLPYSYEDPDLRLLGEGIAELTETFEPDTEEVQYINETAATTNTKGYNVSFTLSMRYIKDDPIQNWINLVVRALPIGSNSMCDYVRFNMDETMYGTNNQFIGVRRRATVQAASIGGASTDSATSEVTISGAGDGIIGFVTVNTTSENPVFTWTAADLPAPVITSPTQKEHVSGENITIQGKGEAANYVVVVYGVNPDDKTLPIQVSPAGDWSTIIEAVRLGKNAKTAAIQYENDQCTGRQSVSSTPVMFTTDAVQINPPVITSPTDGAASVPVNTSIQGTGLSGAVVTVNYGSGTLGQATVDTSGDWALTPASPLTSAAQYTINARQRSGNSTSNLSTSVTFTTA